MTAAETECAVPAVPRVCFDRVLPYSLMALQDTRKVRRPGGSVLFAIAPIGKMWINGSTLRVRFIGGTTSQRAVAMEQARWWSAVCNIKFEFVDDHDAEIRCSFDESDGAWSYLGTDCRGIPFEHATMNLGFLDGGTAGHEFGHALGLTHEHQNPDGGILWDEAAVIAALAGPPNFWDETTTRHNVLERYAANQVKGTKFDPESIMLYFFPASWTTNGVGTRQNDVLSKMDKQFIASSEMYPLDGEPSEPDATLLTVDAAKRTKAAIGTAGEEDLYAFDVVRPGRYIVDTRGATDVVLKLFGPDSYTALIAEDDDSGYAWNARVALGLVPGRYYAQVRHYSTEHGVGNYSIKVRTEVV
jgi:hypothetical protein